MKVLLKIQIAVWVSVLIPAVVAAQGATKYGPPCSIGDPSVAWYLSLDDGAQKTFVDEYRLRFEPILAMATSELPKLFSSQAFSTGGRLKTTRSIREKILRKIADSRGYSCFNEFSDIAGARVIVPNYATFPFVASRINSSFKVLKVDTQLSPDPTTQYRSVHYDVLVADRRVELQVHTRRSVLVADASHKLIYKGPYSRNDPVKSTLAAIAFAAFRLDSHLAASYPSVPRGLPEPARLCFEKLLTQLNGVRLTGVFDPKGECPEPPRPSTTSLFLYFDFFDMADYVFDRARG